MLKMSKTEGHMTSNRFKFTNTNIKLLPTPEKRTFYYDTVEPKLSLQITPNGAKSFYVRQRVKGNDVRVKLGEPPIMTVEEARMAAVANRKMMNEGKNPLQQSKKYRAEDKLQKLFDDFVEERGRFIGERTMANYKSMWRTKLNKLANKRLSDISSEDLKELHRKISETAGNYTGNHCIALVRTVYNYAIKEERFDGRNPADAVHMNKKEPRVRYLEHDEMKRFFKALENYDNETSRDAILMLLFTGVRKTNVFEMAWKDIDMDAKVWKIPQTKTAKNVTIALVEPALEILRRRKEQSQSEWVFSSAYSASGHIVELKRAFSTILKMANITNFRIHDLRHTLGTYLTANGADAFMVKRALTHQSLQSTQVYVNLGVEHLRAILNDTVEKMIKIGKD